MVRRKRRKSRKKYSAREGVKTAGNIALVGVGTAVAVNTLRNI